MVFKNEKQLKDFLLAKCERALILAQEDIYRIIDDAIRAYYKDFDPDLYERTHQLFNSFVMTDIIPDGNGYKAEVYFDLDGIKYVTGNQPTGEEVMAAASQGLHGAIGEKFLYRHGRTTGVDIWNTPSQRIDAEAIKILEQKLKAQGIPIKKA